MTQLLTEGSLPPGQQQILDHINKADVAPVDFRVLTSENKKVFTDFMKNISPTQKSKILIVR